MTIEATLERIAVALEAIANSKALPITGGNPAGETKPANTEAVATVQKTRPGKKTETQKVEEAAEARAREGEEIPTEDEDFSGEELIDESLKQVHDDTPLKWADINKEVLGHCTAVSEAKGRPAGQEVYSTFKTKYANGEKLTEATVKPGLYRALLAEVRELAAEFEAANG